MSKTPILLIMTVLAAVAAPAGAAEQSLALDLETTSVTFTLGAALHTVHGAMHLRAGKIGFDLDSGVASGEVIFDARRTDTGNKKRDKNMHRDVLQSEAFPAIVFRPTAVRGELADGGRSEVILAGTVSIHGAEHALQISAEVERSSDRISATAGFAVPFVAWGMEDPSGLLLRVDKHVDVSIEVRGTLSTP